MTNEETMALCAIRYARNSGSYYITLHGKAWAISWGRRSKNLRDVIIHDLEYDFSRCDDGVNVFADKENEKVWRGVLKELRDMNK